jgi:transcription elongation factor Elf1
MLARDNPKKKREWWNNWYRKNKKKKVAWQTARREKLQKWFSDLKKTLKCAKCPERHPACLVFHHKDPNQKDFDLGADASGTYSMERIDKEIKKCVVLCANCHAKLHWKLRSVG